MMAVFEALCSFNSTLVQLKVSMIYHIGYTFTCFNSTLVQLKAQPQSERVHLH